MRKRLTWPARVAAAMVLLTAAAAAQGLRLNEVLANPDEALGTEWIEVANESAAEVDLAGWLIGDALREVVITSGSVNVPAGGFIVLAQDSAAFRAYFAGPGVTVVEPASWPVLNNTGDTVRLIDADSVEIDRFAYIKVFPGNITWSRDPEDPTRWGESRTAGGTPGEANELGPTGVIARLRVDIEPRVFSPDGDGVEDSTLITIIGPASGAYTIEVYDREGRRVWNHDIGEGLLAEAYIWRGTSPSGSRLPVGVYIVYVEGENGESAMKTVVIAR